MQLLRAVLLLALFAIAGACSAQVEFRLAYQKDMPMSVPVTFPNDQSFKYMSAVPLIGAADFKKATAVLQHGAAMLQIEISESARESINALAAKNRSRQARGEFTIASAKGGIVPQESSRSGMLLLILCLLFGIFGAHRFYAGKVGSGVAQLLTLGGLGVWALVDLLIVLFAEFTDSEGLKINPWQGI